MSSSTAFSAVAVCGCGHDGRLGLGTTDANVSTPTLIPVFLPSIEGTGEGDTVSDKKKPAVIAIACGGYHTIVVASDGVYGWGANESGQLGLGKHAPHVTSPTRLTFFDKMKTTTDVSALGGASGEDSAERVVHVACGGRHSFVLTTAALYCCGANECGQLGLQSSLVDGGSPPHLLQQEEAVFTWRMVCLFGRRTAQWEQGEELPTFILSLTPSLLVVACSIEDVSCGTNHTLLALRNVVTAGKEASSEHKVHYWPCMVLAAGKGDFGELGYDGTADEVERELHRMKQAAVLKDALNAEKQGSMREEVPALSAAGGSSNDPLYKFKMKYKQVQRRPPFLSASFRPVHFSQAAAHAVFAPTPLPELEGRVHDEAVLGAAVAARRADGSSSNGTLSVLASHLHSAVSFACQAHSGAVSDNILLHWGCYYCDAIETTESSIPRPVRCENESFNTGQQWMHGGNEVAFHYAAGANGGICVMGKGNLGRGEEDDFSEKWHELSATKGFERVVGKDHYLLLESSGNAVLGFGDNLHGQLGAVCVDAGAAVSEDRVLVPHTVLKAGSQIGNGWVVERIKDVAAGARHSVFLLDVKHSVSS